MDFCPKNGETMRIGRAVLIIAGFSLVFSACGGGLGTVLPSQGTYRVNAYVGDDSLEKSLNEYSIIKQIDEIRPFFITSVADDPDIRGLTVFVQTSLGAAVGGKVRYSLFSTAVETKSTQELPANGDLEIPVARLDKVLPAFRLPGSLEIGSYSMVFQVIGEKEVLYQTDKPFYFLSDAEFSLGDIQNYLPGSIEGTNLIPAGINIVLETGIQADPRLDPYVVWYEGKKSLASGRVSKGGASLLWKSPERQGFHAIRVEVYPFLAGGVIEKNITGMVKETPLAIVSVKMEDLPFFTGTAQFSHWYRLWGTLEDAQAPHDAGRELIPQNTTSPRWLPFGSSYGLAIGPGDVYSLPAMTFGEAGRNRAQVRLHFVPMNPGPVFRGLFTWEGSRNGSNDGGSLSLDLSLEPESLVWTITGPGLEPYTESMEIAPIASGKTPLGVLINLVTEPSSLKASLELEIEGAGVQSGEKIIPLGASLTGGFLQLGAGPSGGAEAAPQGAAAAAILDEAAVIFSVESRAGNKPEGSQER